MIGRLEHAAMLPCLLASIVNDQTCVAWGIGHTHYHVAVAGTGGVPDAWLMGKVVLAAIALAPLHHPSISTDG